jgi:HEAT repeat protein
VDASATRALARRA